MKKIFVYVFISLVFISSVFADWFDPRKFEFGIDLPAGFSNNAVQINEILTKNVVLDFREISNNLPNNGMELYSYSNPNIYFSLNLEKISIGAKTGVESWGSAVISKDFFDYIGKGNELGETISISQNINADVFAYQEFSVGFDVKQFKVVVRPAFFVPFFHIGSEEGNLTMVNDEDGNLIINYYSEMAVYSAMDLNDGGTSFWPGFDVSASVSYPLYDFLILTGNIRMPIIPGQLGYKMISTTKMDLTTSVDKIVNGNIGEKDSNTELSDTSSATYKINRPLKLNVFGDFTPVGDWIVFTGGLGIGFRHPFTTDMDSFEVFPEYYLGGRVLFGNILSAGLSTQYYERLFIHQLDLRANVRVFELDFGISSQSTGFLKSCSGGGIGTYITLKFGY